MNLHRALPSLAIGVIAVVALAGCGKISNSYGSAQSSASSGGAAQASSTPASSGSGAVTPVGGTTVTIQNFTFVPQTLTIKAGSKVTWTNRDSTVHDVTSTNGAGTGAATTSLFSSGVMNSGQSFSFTFTKAGTYFYECSIHAAMPSMHAEVIVK